jgi:hypothetical protein
MRIPVAEHPPAVQFGISLLKNAHEFDRAKGMRRGGRVVECGGLENRYTGNRIGGSNPPFSANLFDT